MNPPLEVLGCIRALEAAGYPAYAVGGCVRDALLGLTPKDYDLCTAARPEQIKAVFADRPLVLAGEKHGTVGVVVPGGVVEITAFRAEGGYRDGRHPGWVRFGQDLEADLARRDFTINAMAWSPDRGLADPFGGQADLAARRLRAVGDPAERFSEDALRILRCARFSICYRLVPEEATLQAAVDLAPRIAGLAAERVFAELCGLLPQAETEDLLRFAPILTQAVPELAPQLGFDQRNPHHIYDLFTHTAHVTAAVGRDLAVRWAALLHDVGKPAAFTLDENGRGHFYGHAQLGAETADEALRRLRAPTALRERAVLLVRLHMDTLAPDRRLLRRRLNQYGPEAVGQLLELQRADLGGKGAGEEDGVFDRIAAMLTELTAQDRCQGLKDLAVNGRDLMAAGYPEGPALGACLSWLLERVQEEALPNTREALLSAAAARLAPPEKTT